MFANNEPKKEYHFTQEQFKVAATWWAQFLPMTADKCYRPHDVVTMAQRDNFISLLTKKIEELSKGRIGKVPVSINPKLHYFAIPPRNSMQVHQVIEDALAEANIRISCVLYFPVYEHEMRIFDNGQIRIGNQVISVDPKVIYYDKNFDFSAAPLMKITGEKFRLLKINMNSIQGPIFRHPGKKIDIHDYLYYGDDENEIIEIIYLNLLLSGFKGSEKEFLALTDEELINILQNEQRFSERFNSCVVYSCEKNEERALKSQTFNSLGVLHTEAIDTRYYQYVSEPMKVLAAPAAGSFTQDGWGGVKPIFPNDFVLLSTRTGKVFALQEDSPDFGVQLCDQNGKALSSTVYKRGDTLPTKNLSTMAELFQKFNITSRKQEVDALVVIAEESEVLKDEVQSNDAELACTITNKP